MFKDYISPYCNFIFVRARYDRPLKLTETHETNAAKAGLTVEFLMALRKTDSEARYSLPETP